MIKSQNNLSATRFLQVADYALKELIKNDPLRLAGATSFFTTFALPPILLIIIQVLGLLFDPQRIRHELFQRLGSIIGNASMQQVINTLTAFKELAKNWYVTVGGFVFLIFVATTLFAVIKSSLNQLWNIKVVHKRSLWVRMRTRFLSVVVIIIAGVLFVIGLLAEGVQAFLGGYISRISPQLEIYFNSTLNYVLSIIIVTIWFAIVFRFLPDGRPAWKVAFTGAFVTGFFFTIGKLVLHWLLSYSNINTLYGASGSIVLLLLFVFYSSFILYYGAAFTKEWGLHIRQPIQPLPYAMHYHLTVTKI
jgi:membrane protein